MPRGRVFYFAWHHEPSDALIWKRSDLWPTTDEQATSIVGTPGKPSIYSGFCPEVAFEGLTNRRAIIVSGIFAKTINSLPLRTLTAISVRERQDRTGTVLLGRPHPFASWYAGMQGPGMGQYSTPRPDKLRTKHLETPALVVQERVTRSARPTTSPATRALPRSGSSGSRTATTPGSHARAPAVRKRRNMADAVAAIRVFLSGL